MSRLAEPSAASNLASMASAETRIRERLFPHVPVYDHRAHGGYSPFLWVFRHLQFLFTPRNWQVYCYFVLRTGPDLVAWPTLRELSWDLDFRSIPKLKAHLKQLLDDGWLVHQTERGRDYYVPQDPLAVLATLRDGGRIPADRLHAIEELLERIDLKLAPNPADAGGEQQVPKRRRRGAAAG